MAFAMTASAAIPIKVATYFPPSHPAIKSLELFKERLAKETNGELDVQIFPNSQLGTEEVYIDSVRRGIVEMGVNGLLIRKDEPLLNLMEVPFMVETWKQAKAAFTGEVGQMIIGNYYKNTGVYIMGFTVNGFREISSSFELKTMDDFKKMKIRVPSSESYVKLFTAWGFTPTMMPYAEVYNGLEMKVVDGQDNPYPAVWSNGWWEVQKFLLETRHIFAANAIIVNGKFFDKLSADQQAKFKACLNEAIEHNWSISEQEDLEAKKNMTDKGLKVNLVSPEMRQQMRNALGDYFKWLYANIPGADKVYEKASQLPK
jgi:tripartite ATP-independent transporter DctP family solute receptor